MSKELSVDEQALKRKTRRRLIGAAALTLLAVVLLPMLLDNEPKQSGQNISFDISSPETVSDFSPHVPPVETLKPASETPAVPPADNPPTEPTLPIEPVPSKPKPSGIAAPVMVIPPLSGANRSKQTGNKHYLLHIGNYSNPAIAAQVVEKLKQNNLNVTVEKSNHKTRIHVGPFAEREQADKARLLLQKQGTRSTLMVIP